jgi:hypothetical protein
MTLATDAITDTIKDTIGPLLVTQFTKQPQYACAISLDTMKQLINAG